MINSDKFRFVGATAKQCNMYDTQLSSQPRIGESAFTIPADPKKSLDEGSLTGSHEYLDRLKEPRVCENYYILLNNYYDIIFVNN